MSAPQYDAGHEWIARLGGDDQHYHDTEETSAIGANSATALNQSSILDTDVTAAHFRFFDLSTELQYKIYDSLIPLEFKVRIRGIGTRQTRSLMDFATEVVPANGCSDVATLRSLHNANRETRNGLLSVMAVTSIGLRFEISVQNYLMVAETDHVKIKRTGPSILPLLKKFRSVSHMDVINVHKTSLHRRPHQHIGGAWVMQVAHRVDFAEQTSTITTSILESKLWGREYQPGIDVNVNVVALGDMSDRVGVGPAQTCFTHIDFSRPSIMENVFHPSNDILRYILATHRASGELRTYVKVADDNSREQFQYSLASSPPRVTMERTLDESRPDVVQHPAISKRLKYLDGAWCLGYKCEQNGRELPARTKQ